MSTIFNPKLKGALVSNLKINDFQLHATAPKTPRPKNPRSALTQSEADCDRYALVALIAAVGGGKPTHTHAKHTSSDLRAAPIMNHIIPTL